MKPNLIANIYPSVIVSTTKQACDDFFFFNAFQIGTLLPIYIMKRFNSDRKERERDFGNERRIFLMKRKL